MGSALRSAMLLLALSGIVQSAPVIEATCEWIDTGEPCRLNEPWFGAGLTFNPQSIEGFGAGVGEGFADVPHEQSHLARVSYSAVEMLELPFIVRGGSGEGRLRTYATITGSHGGCGFTPDPHIPYGDANGHESTIPFTYNQPIFLSFSAACSGDGIGSFIIDSGFSFTIFAPEGGYFEEYVAPIPEPSSLALIASGVAGLLFRPRRITPRA